ncbi:MAG TPA: 6-phospho-beta-glucosidase [Armatimonadota bacterium]|mgnify:FL=1|nr:6-phospho-beta-glucosidase [Armatimonadota bacterium]
MRDGITLAIIGAGSSYTPELIQGVIERSPHALPVAAIQLIDRDARRLDIMAGLTERMAAAAGVPVRVLRETAPDALSAQTDFIVTQIRVGGMAARHLDETIPLKYGIIGQETTGPGGLCKALRTIPAMLEIARAVEQRCPHAFILNYTNPSGVITEAVRKYSGARIIGLCAGIPSLQAELAAALAETYPDLRTYCVGLNHLGFVHRFRSGGREVTADAIARFFERELDEGQQLQARIARLVGAVPIGYLNYYVYRKLSVEKALAAARTRAQTVETVEAEILAEAAKPDTVGKPAALAARGGGGYADITFAVLRAILHDTGAELAANVPSAGSVDGIEDDAVAEVVCRVDRTGATPLPVGPIPLAFRGLVQAVKAYETLTVEAAVHRSARLARQALLNHPLVGDLDIIEPLLEEMLAAHGLDFTA